jgi:copper chaperone
MLLNVKKMTCNHCIRSVTAAVHTIDPQALVKVDLPSGTVRIDGIRDGEAAAKAIREAGFTVEVPRH